MLTIIAAMDNEMGLGKENKLLWNIPEEMRHFKQMTMGKTVVMGRKTFDSIGRILPNRKNIVITRDESYDPENVVVYNSIEAFLIDYGSAEEEVMIIGGGSIYEQFLSYADKMILSFVEGNYDADVFFPSFVMNDWSLEDSFSFDSFIVKIFMRK